MEDNPTLPTFILNTKYICTEHKEKLTEFCRMHDLPICIKCHKKFHSKCEDVPKIDDIVRNVKESVIFEDIFVEIEGVCDNLKEFFKDRVKNKQQLEEKRATIEKSLEERIEKTIKHLRNIKETTLQDFDLVTSEISKTSQIVQSKEKKLRDILHQKSEIMRLASNYQTFIGVKQMENMVEETNMEIQELSRSGAFNQHDVTFDFNETLEGFCRITSLGDIRVTQSLSAVSIKMTRPADLEAQKEVQNKEPIQLHFQQKIELPHSTCKGCCTLPSGFMVFTEVNVVSNNSNVHIYNSEGYFRSTVKFEHSGGIFAVKPVDFHHFVESHPWSHSISVIDTNTYSVVRSLETEWIVYGLCCSGRNIVCCVSGKGLVSVNLDSGRRESVKIDKNVGFGSHVEVSKNMICYTCPDLHTVNVLDNKYKAVFNYKDEAVFKHPLGVTLDDHCNIFFTGFWSNNLIVISADGKSCRQILGENDGLNCPTGVHYDSRTKKLIVLNSPDNSNSAFVYIVQGTFVGKDEGKDHEPQQKQGKDHEPHHAQGKDHEPHHPQGMDDKQKQQRVEQRQRNGCTIS